MTRTSFLKSLIALVIAPKVLSEIEFKSTQDAVINSTRSLITDLNKLHTEYIDSFTKKYGNEDYKLFLELFQLDETKPHIKFSK